MSTTKLDTSDTFQPLTVVSAKTRLPLPAHAVTIRKSGIEFRSVSPFEPWTEMSVELKSPRDNKKVSCTGIVVACNGNRHAGYLVSMLFLNLTPQSREQLGYLATYSQLS